ncbi:aspartate kinase [Fulvivirga sediminis]|uniref:Aspartokinase n=1 Tax=Fulvivirga sediminis TaxID=2803949 RepID=A0A937F9Y8_9BACT|nr:aspartate kinase [Fulvivirga sediminis]MBL3657004.1 aspartate kinase [Fulvivirga sediminis]
MIIYKFGGTSVGLPERMHKVADLITADSEPKIVVLSAVSGTTNSLVEIGDLLLDKKQKEAKVKVDILKKHYSDFINNLYSTEQSKNKGSDLIEGFFESINALTNIPDFNEGNNKTLLAFGEIMATNLFHQYLIEKEIDSSLLPALDFMSIDENGEPEIEEISTKLKAILAEQDEKQLYITQGFICKNHEGKTDNLQRGGSDYTASLVGAAITAKEVQIWTDINGMHNNDPRIVDNTFPISELSFDEAAELAYFGAKILHPSSILPAQKYGIPVRLKSTIDHTAPGTLINSTTGIADIKAIAAKDGITAIKIKSTRMLLAHGFLRKLFEVFEKYKTSIDMIATSEVAVSVTIDNLTHLHEIVEELENFGYVEVDNNQSIVCVVGSMITEKKGVLTKIFDSLEDITIRMVSYGGSKNNISILVDSKYKNDVLVKLNSIF